MTCSANPDRVIAAANHEDPDIRSVAWNYVCERGCLSPSDCLPARKCLQREGGPDD